MKAVRKRTRDDKPVFILEEMPEPTVVGPTDVKIRIAAIGICTSDIHVLHGVMKMPEGNIVGHEYSGEVIAVGEKVTSFKPGDHVVGELAVGACGECAMCRQGKYEFCRYKKPPGWISHGIYTEYTVMDQRLLHRIPVRIDFDVAALAEPIAICVYGCIERGQIDPVETTVVYGMGSIGLLALIVLLDYGLEKIICVTPTHRSRQRYELAKELGAYRVLSSDEDVEKIIAEETGSENADCVVDCSGAPEAISQGLRILHKDGKLIALGIAPQDTIPVEYNTGIHKALRIVFSSTSSHAAWERTIGILERQHDRIKRIVTHRYPLDNWRTAFDKLEQREAVKAVLVNTPYM